DIATYVAETPIENEAAYDTARLALMDAMGCAMKAGDNCRSFIISRALTIDEALFEIDTASSAFIFGVIIRWLDYNDTWLAAEWGHPSDNLGAILSVASYLSRCGVKLTMRDVLTMLIKAYDIQGGMALLNSFNKRGIDHVILVKLASAAVSAHLLGLSKEGIAAVISQVFCDGGTLRAYRHAPQAGQRKCWAAGDAAKRAVELAVISLHGEPGYPKILTAPTYGFYDVFWGGKEFEFPEWFQYGSYVMENILFKLSPVEFHAQTAVEAAIKVRPEVIDRIPEIRRIVIETQEPAWRIINKSGPLKNPADRDHCLQYAVAVALLKGGIVSEDYENDAAKDSRIDELRTKMEVRVNDAFTRNYYDPALRSVGSSVQVFFKNSTVEKKPKQTKKITIEFPLGHPRRREEALPLIREKFTRNLAESEYKLFTSRHREKILELFDDLERFDALPVPQFMDIFVGS
ncbi:bifunctional 2-methylcitrate dehydratase/aconitate hydratase, partial [bacterium]|nr:bifunctional 2-methylcitrate dehydratase/aconitate hydratase [bacterium]